MLLCSACGAADELETFSAVLSLQRLRPLAKVN